MILAEHQAKNPADGFMQGSALLSDFEHFHAVIAAPQKGRPLSVRFRRGWHKAMAAMSSKIQIRLIF